jgi:hypothetical protein
MYLRAGRFSHRIRCGPKTADRQQLIKTLKTLLQSSNIDPDRVIMWEALAEPHRTLISPEDIEDKQIGALANAFKESMKRELMDELSLGPDKSNITPYNEWARRDSNSGSPPISPRWM